MGDAVKVCSKCHEAKPHTEYYQKGGGERRADCRDCVLTSLRQKRAADPEKYRDLLRQWRAAHPGASAGHQAAYYARHGEELRLLNADKAHIRKFRMTLEEKAERLAAQGGVCAVCGTDTPDAKGWQTDHDHACCASDQTCGKCVRGILCRACNVGLGHFKDDPVLLQRAIKYVQQHTKEIANV